MAIKFKEFPNAFPHFRESELSAKKAEAGRLLSSRKALARKRGRELNRKRVESQTYYDLSALKSRSIPPTKENFDKLIQGFFTRNFDKYRKKGSGARRDVFVDKDSRWFGMSRPTVRDIVMDEIFTASYAEDAKIPTPEESTAAQQGALPAWFLLSLGFSAAVALGYALHSRTK